MQNNEVLSKSADSEVLLNGLLYKKNSAVNNRNLRELLLKEQKGFCAYTEEYLIANTLCPEVEHFNTSKKYQDDYYNYYVVSRFANQRKMKVDKSADFIGESFFENCFFHDKSIFDSRIEYREGIYKQRKEDDLEAKRFIEYMGFIEPIIYSKRANLIRRLKNQVNGLSKDEISEYLKAEEKDFISFPTAIENELEIDLSEIINQ